MKENVMRLEVKGRNVEVNDSIRRYAEEKLDRIERQLPDETQIEVELTLETNPSISADHVAEATVWTKGSTLRAREASNAFETSIDQLSDKLERQVERYREKRSRRGTARRTNGQQTEEPTFFSGEQLDRMIVKSKQFDGTRRGGLRVAGLRGLSVLSLRRLRTGVLVAAASRHHDRAACPHPTDASSLSHQSLVAGARMLDLFSQQLLAGAAIFGALVGKAHAVFACEFGGGFQGGTGHGRTSILVDLDTRRFAARRSDIAAPRKRFRNRRSGAHATSCIPALRSRRDAPCHNRNGFGQLFLISTVSAL
jgi:putative sigma-54 modulation protein